MTKSRQDYRYYVFILYDHSRHCMMPLNAVHGSHPRTRNSQNSERLKCVETAICCNSQSVQNSVNLVKIINIMMLFCMVILDAVSALKMAFTVVTHEREIHGILSLF